MHDPVVLGAIRNIILFQDRQCIDVGAKSNERTITPVTRQLSEHTYAARPGSVSDTEGSEPFLNECRRLVLYAAEFGSAMEGMANFDQFGRRAEKLRVRALQVRTYWHERQDSLFWGRLQNTTRFLQNLTGTLLDKPFSLTHLSAPPNPGEF
jgi:hypothetical protein